MNFLHLVTSLDPEEGGVAEGVRQLHAALRALGHGSELATLDAPGAPWLDVQADTHALGPALGNYAYCARLVSWLRRHAGRHDAVIVNGLWQYTGLAARRALAGGGTPYFVFPHGMLDPWFQQRYRLKHLKKRLYWPWAEYRVLRDAAGVLFTCEEEQRLARQAFAPYHCREFIASYGTAAPPADAQAQQDAFYTAFPALRAKRLLLFLGRLHEKKGCDLLLDAFAAIHADRQASGLHLVMAGTGPTQWQTQLQARATALGIAERICWTGQLSGPLKWSALRASEAFCLPSHQENFGLAVVEALACGCPVLISNKVNIWREIQADGAGLIQPDTREGCLRLLQDWLALPPSRREAMRRATLRSFALRFQMAQVAQNLLRIVRQAAPPDRPTLHHACA